MDAEQILKQPPSEAMIKQVNELADKLFDLKKSDEAGGLPDMHIEQILIWYRVTVEQEIAKAKIEEQENLIAAIDKNDTARPHKVVEGDLISYVDHGYSLLARQIKHNANNRIKKLSQTLKEHKDSQ